MTNGVSSEMLDEKTPPEVQVTNRCEIPAWE
jgi:hypothetical protein